MKNNMDEKKDAAGFPEISLSKAALIAGICLVIMTILAFVSFPILQNFIEPADATKTANTIISNQLLFRVITCAFLIVIILDVIVAWALNIFLKPVNESLALLMAWFRVVYAAIFAAALNNLFTVIHILEKGQSHDQAMVFINAFYHGWDIGLAVFGLHMLLLGYLVYKSGYIPKLLGVLVIIASFGYLIDSFGELLSPSYGLSIGMFTFIGEVLLALWLLWKGRKILKKTVLVD